MGNSREAGEEKEDGNAGIESRRNPRRRDACERSCP
jgi:hypothetical protein